MDNRISISDMKVCNSIRHKKAVVTYSTAECPLCIALDILPEGEIPECSMPLSNLVNPSTRRRLSVRAMNVLEHIGAKTVMDIKPWTRHKLMKVKNCGKGTADEILAMVYANTEGKMEYEVGT